MMLHPLGLTPVQAIANPAVTIGRAFTDTYGGISPAGAPGFVAAQPIGLIAAIGLVALFYPPGGSHVRASVHCGIRSEGTADVH